MSFHNIGEVEDALRVGGLSVRSFYALWEQRTPILEERPHSTDEEGPLPSRTKPADRAKWLRVNRVFGEQGIGRDNARGRLEFGRRMERQRRERGENAGFKEIRREWRFGSEEFAARILDLVEGACGESQTRREHVESMAMRAEQLVAPGMQTARWNEKQLPEARKGHPVKVRLART